MLGLQFSLVRNFPHCVNGGDRGFENENEFLSIRLSIDGIASFVFLVWVSVLDIDRCWS